MSRLLDQLKRHEGFRGNVYKDSVGKLTVGYGHNLEDTPMSMRVAEILLREDLEGIEKRLKNLCPWYLAVRGARRDALLNMAFNLGPHGLLGFRRMWEAIKVRDWDRAADEALDSKWATQVGRRATELAQQLRTGQYA